MSKITRTSTLLSKARDEIVAHGRTTGVLARKGRVCAIGGVYLAAGIDITSMRNKQDIDQCDHDDLTWNVADRMAADKAINLLNQINQADGDPISLIGGLAVVDSNGDQLGRLVKDDGSWRFKA